MIHVLQSQVTAMMDAPHKITTDRVPLGRALVVDDQAVALKLVQRMLEILGFSTVAVSGGRDAMVCLNQYRYDLLLTDLQMPDMDGYSLAGWLKHQWQDTPVIIMTGTCPAEVAGFMRGNLVDHWLFKPFTLNELAAAVKKFVRVKDS
ncbi:MAG: response regulator [Desulfobacteraceae bacterium]|nr:response regulator [Desulfobacteraceae bacterium]